MITTDYTTKIAAFYRQHHRIPRYREICALLGFRSTNAASKLVKELIARDILQKDETGRLAPGRRLLEIPVLGMIEAGWPSPAEEELLDTMSLDDFLIGNREATYILRVQGDSMIEAGIMPGDMVLVERTETASSGDIVIAEIDTKFTLKYLRKRGRKVWLESGNKKYKPFYPKAELKIVAVVTSVIRKYRACSRSR